MEIGIDSFARARDINIDETMTNVDAMEELLERIELADKSGLHVFGIGEHYRQEFLDSAPSMILAAASQRTKNIKLTSAVTVLSTADPVRVFQNYSTLDLLSDGRAEMVVGRGSFTEAFPLFGYSRSDYDELFVEKLDLLLKIREQEIITWKGKFRAPLHQQAIYPRPKQERIPIWLGVGGTPASFERAGKLGLPLMVAVIGGETRRFKPLIDLYRRAFLDSGHPEEDMRVGLHSLGYVAETTEKAIEEYYPGYKLWFDQIGKERGWPPVSKDRFLWQNSREGAYLVGDPEEVADKILRHSDTLGGISRFTFQMDNAGLTRDQITNSIKLIGSEVIPRVQKGLQSIKLMN
ncbi:MAG: LLM class flavin-dependent oxidoreductase [Candidatus Heimdallarchaeota archaeon]|nr:LLM class flavin-dependent oxidoreductase [Candidatus Heimdallarchaeota archaeon]